MARGENELPAVMTDEPIRIDALQACRQSSNYAFELGASHLSRLRDNDIELVDTVVVKCDFYRDDNHKPFMKLFVEGVVVLPCQRCFEPMDVGFSSEQELVLLVSEHQDEQNFAPDHEPVWLESGEWLVLNQVIEDEILLSLPTAALHDPKDCAVKFDDDMDVTEELEEAERENPFAILAQLKESS